MKHLALRALASMMATTILLASAVACSPGTPTAVQSSAAPASGESAVSADGGTSSETGPSGSSQETDEEEFKTYFNALYGYSVPYPAYIESAVESDSGDGVTLTNKTADEILKIWAQYDIDSLTGQAMLEEAKTRVAHIVMEEADDTSFYILYQGGDGGEGGIINFFEYGLIKDGTIVRFLFRYPLEVEAEYDDIIKQMITGLTFTTA